MKLIQNSALVITLALAAEAYAQMPPGGGTPPGGGMPPGGGTPPVTTAAPTLIGDTVTVTEYYPDLGSPGVASTVTVGSSVEIACPDSSVALCNSASGLLPGEFIDIGATSISGRFLASFDESVGDLFNGFVFTGLDFGTGYAGITSYTLVTNIAGLTNADIGFTPNSLFLNLLGLDPSVTTDGTSVGIYTINLNVARAVPEPGALALMLGGVAALALSRRRRGIADQASRFTRSI